jgi:hypothetical protein
LLIGQDLHKMKCVEFSDFQSRTLVQILLRPIASLNLALKLCGMSQWIFQSVQLLPVQWVNSLYG